MKSRRIKFDLPAFLGSLQDPHFTISSLTMQYLNSPNCSHDKERSARQYLYRYIELLVSKEKLIKTGSSKDKTIQYSLPNSEGENVVSQIDAVGSSNKKQDTTQQKLRDKLRDKLKEYKLELLASIGEAEAYKEISEDIPSLLNGVQSKYQLARDNSSKLLGKVNAIETIIKDFDSIASS